MWIEISTNVNANLEGVRSQPARAVWIEIGRTVQKSATMVSQPARAVWIEIEEALSYLEDMTVTACEGCVD